MLCECQSGTAVGACGRYRDAAARLELPLTSIELVGFNCRAASIRRRLACREEERSKKDLAPCPPLCRCKYNSATQALSIPPPLHEVCALPVGQRMRGQDAERVREGLQQRAHARAHVRARKCTRARLGEDKTMACRCERHCPDACHRPSKFIPVYRYRVCRCIHGGGGEGEGERGAGRDRRDVGMAQANFSTREGLAAGAL